MLLSRCDRQTSRVQIRTIQAAHKFSVNDSEGSNTPRGTFNAHNHYLAALGGIPERGICDNMKTAMVQIGWVKQRKEKTPT